MTWYPTVVAELIMNAKSVCVSRAKEREKSAILTGCPPSTTDFRTFCCIIKILAIATWSATTCTFQIELIQPIYQFNNGLVILTAGCTREVYLVLRSAARNLQASKKKKKGINE